jgi:hypothetical protein
MYNVCRSLGLLRPLKIKAVVLSKRREPIYPVTGRHIPLPPKKEYSTACLQHVTRVCEPKETVSGTFKYVN